MSTKSVTVKNQKKKLTNIIGNRLYTLNIRYDDEYGNGYNIFAIDIEVEVKERGQWVWDSSGRDISLFRKAFPKYAKYLKWHGMSPKGPSAYVANSMYHAGMKDHYGKLKGEPYIQEKVAYINDVPIPVPVNNYLARFLNHALNDKPESVDLTIKEVLTMTKHRDLRSYYTTTSWPIEQSQSYQAPFSSLQEAQEWVNTLQTCTVRLTSRPVSFHLGKEPDLEAARRVAIWPEAELEDFTEENLKARLPGLIEAFRKDIEELGFTF